MNRLLNAVLAALLTLLAVGAASAPAQAQTPGGIVNHVADDGYNPPIYVQCANGAQIALGVGSYSRSFCQDVRRFYIAPGQSLKCNYYSDGVPVSTPIYDNAGWQPVGSLSLLECWWRG